MGRLMAANVQRAGFRLRSFDLNGSGNCLTAAEAAQGAEALITMLPDGRAVKAAVQAALPGLSRGAIVIDMSSCDPDDTLATARTLRRKGIAMLDAPVSGAKARAKDGTLSLMVGGDARVLKRARPVLQAMGSAIFHTGALGSGHVVKALNNYLGAAGTIAGFEALLVGEAYGLDTKVMIDVINASTGRNSTTEWKIPQQVFTKAFNSGFQLALIRKDVGIARKLAARKRVPAAGLAATHRLWTQAEKALKRRADHTELYLYLRGLKKKR